MVPEGLQYNSIPNLVTKIKSIGMNAWVSLFHWVTTAYPHISIRLTWAVEMVDDILDSGRDVTLKDSFTKVLGVDNATKVYDAVMKNNPSFAPGITRLQVFDAIAAECAKQQIYVHLDNHVSKAGWCCKDDDGNAWFGDSNFNVTKWKRALGFMAEHGKSWPNLVSMALRNELRKPKDWKQFLFYNWSEWYDNMTGGADAIHKANSDLLIFFSGLKYDSQLRPVFTGDTMGLTRVFNKSELEYANKIVLEVHDYDADTTNCTQKKLNLLANSFGAVDRSNPRTQTVFPLVMSEWGFEQSPTKYRESYASCLRDFLPEQKVGWMTWVLGGSYYVREGVADKDEPWGLLDHEWKEWRCPDCISKGLEPMIQATLGGARPRERPAATE
ncbi:MAG: hypothetical protein Q9219_004671 [cf. Caloplaca sp. 3 TL-2023]